MCARDIVRRVVFLLLIFSLTAGTALRAPEEQKGPPSDTPQGRPARPDSQAKGKGGAPQQQRQQQVQPSRAQRPQREQAPTLPPAQPLPQQRPSRPAREAVPASKPQPQIRVEPQRPQRPDREAVNVQPPVYQPRQPVQRVEQTQERSTWRERRANAWQHEHRTWTQRGGYDGYRVPINYFSSYYGRSHPFRIYTRPLFLTGGWLQFQFGSFWFSLVDPWPEYWADDWYMNDDVYIDYAGDGYYLYNLRYPGTGLAVLINIQTVGDGDWPSVWLQFRAQSWAREHYDWYQRGGYMGYRIPPGQYRKYFGSEHRFRLRGLPLMVVGGYPRFLLYGVWFSLMDPWPEYWRDDWYMNDSLYIVYLSDGYYLCNTRYPGVRIALTVFLD